MWYLFFKNFYIDTFVIQHRSNFCIYIIVILCNAHVLFVQTYHKPYSLELICTLQESIVSLCDAKHDCIMVLKTALKF